MSIIDDTVVYGTEDLLMSLCNSVTKVLTVATNSQIQYSGMVQRITKTCLKPDIGCLCCSMAGSRGWWSIFQRLRPWKFTSPT